MKHRLSLYTICMLSSAATAQLTAGSQRAGAQQPRPLLARQQQPDSSQPAASPPMTKNCDTHASAFISADYLHWQMGESNLLIAVEISNPVAFGGPLPDLVTVIEQNRSAGSGFRIEAGHHFHYDQWDHMLQWTHYNHGTNQSVNTGGNLATLDKVFLASGAVGAGESITLYGVQAESFWSLHFNILNLELGRRCPLSRKVSIYLHGGLQGGWINQTQTIDYPELFDEGFGGIISVVSRNTSNFALIGPVVGLDARWSLGLGLALFSNCSVALMYGYNKAVSRISVESRPLSSPIIINDKRHRGVPAMRIEIGADWIRCFRGWVQARVGLGFECQYWWNQWTATGSSYGLLLGIPISYGDLGLSGLTVEFGISL